MDDLEDLRQLEEMSGPYQPWEQTNEFFGNPSEQTTECGVSKQRWSIPISRPVSFETEKSNTIKMS